MGERGVEKDVREKGGNRERKGADDRASPHQGLQGD